MIDNVWRDTIARNWLQTDEETWDQLKVSGSEKNSTAVVIFCVLVTLEGWPPPNKCFHMSENPLTKLELLSTVHFSLEVANGMVSSTFLFVAGDVIRHGVFMDIRPPNIPYHQPFFQCQSDMVLWKYFFHCIVIEVPSQCDLQNGGVVLIIHSISCGCHQLDMFNGFALDSPISLSKATQSPTNALNKIMLEAALPRTCECILVCRHIFFARALSGYLFFQKEVCQSLFNAIVMAHINSGCWCFYFVALVDFPVVVAEGIHASIVCCIVSKICTVLENCWPFSHTHSIYFRRIQVCKYSVSKVVLQFTFGSALYEGSVAKNTKLVYTREIALSSELLAASKAHVCYILSESPRPANYMVVGDLNMVSCMFYGKVLQSSISKKMSEEMKQGTLGYYFIVVTREVNTEKASVNVIHRLIVALLTHIAWKSSLAKKHNCIVRLFGPNFQGVQFDLSYKQGMFIASISIHDGIFRPIVGRLFVELFLSLGQQISAAVVKLVPNGVFLWLIAWSSRRVNNSDEGYLECYRVVTMEFVCYHKCPIFSWHLTTLLDLLCQWTAFNTQLKCKRFGPVIALHFSSLMIVVFACVYDSTVYAICSPDDSLHWSILLHDQILRITGRLLAKEFGCYWLVTRDHTFTWEPGILDLELCSLPTDSSWVKFRLGKKVSMFLSEVEHCSHASTLLIWSMFHSSSASLTFQAYCSIFRPKEQAIVGVIRALSSCIFYMAIIAITCIIGMRFQRFNNDNQFAVHIVDMRLHFINHMVPFLVAWIYYPDYSELNPIGGCHAQVVLVITYGHSKREVVAKTVKLVSGHGFSEASLIDSFYALKSWNHNFHYACLPTLNICYCSLLVISFLAWREKGSILGIRQNDF